MAPSGAPRIVWVRAGRDERGVAVLWFVLVICGILGASGGLLYDANRFVNVRVEVEEAAQALARAAVSEATFDGDQWVIDQARAQESFDRVAALFPDFDATLTGIDGPEANVEVSGSYEPRLLVGIDDWTHKAVRSANADEFNGLRTGGDE